jgi:hypothetical protein
MASGGVPQSWYPTSHTTVPVSTHQHAPEHIQAPPVNVQEQPVVQQNNINVAGEAFLQIMVDPENVYNRKQAACLSEVGIGHGVYLFSQLMLVIIPRLKSLMI